MNVEPTEKPPIDPTAFSNDEQIKSTSSAYMGISFVVHSNCKYQANMHAGIKV